MWTGFSAISDGIDLVALIIAKAYLWIFLVKESIVELRIDKETLSKTIIIVNVKMIWTSNPKIDLAQRLTVVGVLRIDKLFL